MASSKVDCAKTIYHTQNQHPKIFKLSILRVKDLDSSMNKSLNLQTFAYRNSNMAYFGV